MKNEKIPPIDYSIFPDFSFFAEISRNFANCPYFSSNSNIICKKFETFRQIFIKIKPKKPKIVLVKHVHFSSFRTHTVRPFPFFGSHSSTCAQKKKKINPLVPKDAKEREGWVSNLVCKAVFAAHKKV